VTRLVLILDTAILGAILAGALVLAAPQLVHMARDPAMPVVVRP
jgi:hypothetical protein